MKILILANNQKNIDVIKADIKATEKYLNRYRISQLIEIGDLSSHEVHEVSDVIGCKMVHIWHSEGGIPTLAYKTDDRSNKKDITHYDLIIVYRRFLDSEVDHRGCLVFEDAPVGIALYPVSKEFIA